MYGKVAGAVYAAARPDVVGMLLREERERKNYTVYLPQHRGLVRERDGDARTAPSVPQYPPAMTVLSRLPMTVFRLQENMKTPQHPALRHSATLALLAAMAALPSAYGQTNGSWSSNTTGNWSVGSNWANSTIATGDGAIATFSQNWTGQTVTIDSPYTVGRINAADTTAGGGGLVIGGNSTLTLANGVSTPIIQTDAGFTEFNWLTISAPIAGSNGLDKQGIGHLRLTGSNTFSGTVKMTGTTGGNFLVINSDSALGNSSNVLEVAVSTGATGLYNEAAAGNFTLNASRTITTSGTGDFWVKNKAGANMTIAGVISGSARLRKDDSGILTLTNANTYTGNTFIGGGSLVLRGGNNRLPSNTAVTFGNGATLDVGSVNQAVSSIAGSGNGTVAGSYVVNGVGGILTVNGNSGFTVAGANGTLVNMSGLSQFEYNRSNQNVLVRPDSSIAASTAELRLASNGVGLNTITAAAVTVGTASSSNGADNLATLRLGKDNTINTATIQIGGFNGRGLINFNTGVASPTLKLRGVDGVSALANLNLGLTSSGTRSGAGVLDLTGGSLDALVGNLTIGNNTTAISDNSSLIMPAGVLVASNVNIGTMSAGATNPVLANSLNQLGGAVTASVITFGVNSSTNSTTPIPVFNSSYNLSGGTLRAQTIQAGSGSFNSTSSRSIAWSGGTISNLNSTTNLSISGVAGSGGSLNVVSSGAGVKSFSVDSGRSITFGANSAFSSANGSIVVGKDGAGSLIFASGVTHSFNGTLQINQGQALVNASLPSATVSISGGTLAGVGTVGSVTLSSGSLAPGDAGVGTLNASSFTWNGGTLNFDLSGASISDKISLGNGVFSRGAGAASGFVFDFGGGGVAGGEYTLASFGSFGGSFAFSISNLAADLEGTLSIREMGAIDDLVLTVSAIPEPSSFGVFAGLGALGFLAGRRRRS